MIYESKPGEKMAITKRKAIKSGCDKFEYNGWIYKIDISLVRVARIRVDDSQLRVDDSQLDGDE